MVSVKMLSPSQPLIISLFSCSRHHTHTHTHARTQNHTMALDKEQLPAESPSLSLTAAHSLAQMEEEVLWFHSALPMSIKPSIRFLFSRVHTNSVPSLLRLQATGIKLSSSKQDKQHRIQINCLSVFISAKPLTLNTQHKHALA